MEKCEELLKQILGVLGEIKLSLEDVEWEYEEEDEEELS